MTLDEIIEKAIAGYPVEWSEVRDCDSYVVLNYNDDNWRVRFCYIYGWLDALNIERPKPMEISQKIYKYMRENGITEPGA